MSMAFFLVGLVAFVAPIILYSHYFSGSRILYEGSATCRSYTKTVFERERRYALVFVEVPGYGEILTEISHARAMRISTMTDEVSVKLIQRPFRRPEIASISFAGELPEPAAPSYDGLGLSLYFLILAGASLVWLPSGSGSVAQHIGLFYSALSFAAAGFSINALSKDQVDLRNASAKMLFIPLGRGYVGLYMLLALSTAATIACFWQASLLILLGINTAMAAGSISGLLWRNGAPNGDEPGYNPPAM